VIEVLEWLEQNWLGVLIVLWVVWMFVGEGVAAAFYAVVNAASQRSGSSRRLRRRLTRKEERALRHEVAQARERELELQQHLFVAADIMRDVEAADRVMPQMPQDTMIRVEAFLAEHLQRPELPTKSKPRKASRR
jgi:hypothetical protein